MRVYEFAKSMGLTSNEVLAYMRYMEFNYAKSPSSRIEPIFAQSIKEGLRRFYSARMNYGMVEK